LLQCECHSQTVRASPNKLKSEGAYHQSLRQSGATMSSANLRHWDSDFNIFLTPLRLILIIPREHARSCSIHGTESVHEPGARPSAQGPRSGPC
jgi:hypothetical protein